MDRILIYTDGGARPTNPGPGGWAFVTVFPGSEVHTAKSGHQQLATNNQMEMIAVIKALAWASFLGMNAAPITVMSDSQVVVMGVNEWMKDWKERGWRKSNRKPVLNVELWIELEKQIERFADLQFEHIKGHEGDKYNEMADRLAAKAALDG